MNNWVFWALSLDLRHHENSERTRSKAYPRCRQFTPPLRIVILNSALGSSQKNNLMRLFFCMCATSIIIERGTSMSPYETNIKKDDAIIDCKPYLPLGGLQSMMQWTSTLTGHTAQNLTSIILTFELRQASAVEDRKTVAHKSARVGLSK